jgi:hypothetical protein
MVFIFFLKSAPGYLKLMPDPPGNAYQSLNDTSSRKSALKRTKGQPEGSAVTGKTSGRQRHRPAGPPMPASVGTAHPPGWHGPASAGTEPPVGLRGPASAGPARPEPASHRALRRSTAVASATDGLAGHPTPRYRLRSVSHEGGRARGARILDPLANSTSVGGAKGVRTAPSRASAEGGPAPASADAAGTLEDSDGFGRRPAWLRPHCDLGEGGRTENGKEATTAAMRHGC